MRGTRRGSQGKVSGEPAASGPLSGVRGEEGAREMGLFCRLPLGTRGLQKVPQAPLSPTNPELSLWRQTRA